MTTLGTFDCFSLTGTSLTAQHSTATSLDDMDAVVALYQPRIFRFLLVSLRDRDIALSLAQDTFLHAWRARSSFRGECGLYTWLMRIAVNLLRDHTRTARVKFWKHAANPSLAATSLAAHLPHRVSSAESRLIAQEQLDLIWSPLATLSSRQRNIFLLRFVDGLELHDIATVTAMPVSTVKSHLYRALATVRTRHSASHHPVKEQP